MHKLQKRVVLGFLFSDSRQVGEKLYFRESYSDAFAICNVIRRSEDDRGRKIYFQTVLSIDIFWQF